MPQGYRIFVSGVYKAIEVAETPEEAVAGFIADARYPIPIDGVRAEEYHISVARYRVTMRINDESVVVEINAFADSDDDIDYRARRALKPAYPNIEEATVISRTEQEVYPLANRILPFPGRDRTP